MRKIEFVLPFALKSLNKRQRLHWSTLSRERKLLAQEVMAALGGPRYYPRPPIRRVRLTVRRSSYRLLDTVNLWGSAKDLEDVLCVKSATHPAGLGIIEDDDQDHCELIVKQERGKPQTRVTIEWS